jgi:hypothetical protein
LFPNLDELLLNPAVASAVVVAIVTVISQATGGIKPTWLSLVVALVYMVGGYLVTGRTAPEQLFLAAIYALLLVAPLSHVDGAVLNRLFGGSASVRSVDNKPSPFQPTL